MKIFRNYTYSWWNMGILKLTLLSIGILVGVHWYGFFLKNLFLFQALAGVLAIYIISITFKK